MNTFAGSPTVIPPGEDLEAIPAGPAVFLVITPREPYLGKTAVLRRRLKRLLSIDSWAQQVLYWPTGSRLQAGMILYELARQHLPDRYIQFLKLRMPPYVKVLLANMFPRTQVTARLSGGEALYFGPFRTRASAELFDHEFLDLFQMRRCQEDLQPSPDHPGCMYGEMSMCLRPCQHAVGVSEYRSEVDRVTEFLSTGGKQLLHNAEAGRDRLSQEMEFEAAAREHKRVERIEGVLKLRDELVQDINRLYGVAVTPCAEGGSVYLWFMCGGTWQAPMQFCTEQSNESVSLDRRLKDSLAGFQPSAVPLRDRQEHLAILARWYYSSWRDGEWVPFDSLDRLPYRRIVHAISRASNTHL